MVSDRLLTFSRWLVVVIVCCATGAEPCFAQAEYGASAAVTRETFEQSRSVAVVRRAEADRSAAGDVGDMLERAPGVLVQRTASGSAVPILRGLTGSQVLLMLDDLRLNDALTRAGGGATLGLVDPESVAHIEVVRGPASVLYGSDALGGVVHIRTRDTVAGTYEPAPVSATAFARAASAERALRARGSLSAGTRTVGLWLSGGGGHAGALDRGGGLGPQPFTGHSDRAFSGKLELHAARGHELSLTHQSGRMYDMPRPDISRPGDVRRTLALERESSQLSYRGRLFDRKLRLHAYLGISQRSESRQRLRPALEQRESERVRSYQAGLRASLMPWRWATLELGIETVLDRVESVATQRDDAGVSRRERGRYVDGSHYDMHALYLLLSQRLSERYQLLLGARGTLVSARAPSDPLFVASLGEAARLDRRFARPVLSFGVRADLTPAWSWVTSLLGGFRAPNLEDFQAFGDGARGYSVPNLALREERSWTLESGIERRDAQWDFSAFVFASALSGLIVRVPATLAGESNVDGEPVIGRRNASESILLGAELLATRRFASGLFASAATWATWGRSERPSASGVRVVEPASKVPPPVALFRGGYDSAGQPYFADAQLTFQLPQRRLSEADRADVRLCPRGAEGCTRVPGYAELTLRVGVRLREGLLATVALENIFDSAHRTFASGAYAPGRNFVAALRGQW